MDRSESSGMAFLRAGRQIKKMPLGPRTRLIMALLSTFTGPRALAQSVHFLPEADAHLTMNSALRTYLEAKDDRDEGATDQFSFGPSFQFYFKPLLKLKKITAFDLDDSKPRPLVLEMGYRYVTAPNVPPTNRMQPSLTFHVPLKAGLLISDRNRAEIDWKNGDFTWRYRNKLTLERALAVYSYHFIPYVAAELYYVEKYQKWSTTNLYVGARFPVGKHAQFNAYYEYENNTGKEPNQQTNSIGLALGLFFSLKKK
jgi:uncharacterized protein DUF2490